jgi:hypothetical protein
MSGFHESVEDTTPIALNGSTGKQYADIAQRKLGDLLDRLGLTMQFA